MQSDGKCFAYGDMQWDSTDPWDARSKLGGAEVLLNGAGNVGTGALSSPATFTSVTSIKGGPVGATAGVGLACVVGIGAFLSKKKKRTSGPVSMEMKDGQLHAVRTV
ncbi:hypothetical protein TrRE_jg9619 [Triparma retinervis]|uniref:Uncharacterized protein n=1 Tax=Triparma retinervis TaxID=2557542 RepID=A0A9W7A3J7_9STRA|nr:hypothetical protein TrRE_jg9619 [Triparma retinervis]